MQSFLSCINRLDFGFGLDQAMSIFNYLDVDNSGLVDKDDFVKAIKNLKFHKTRVDDTSPVQTTQQQK